MRQAEAPFRRSGGLTIVRISLVPSLQDCLGEAKAPPLVGYCFASGAANTCLQAAGNCASVIGGRGFGGTFGGFG
jgi:hypothetical protein